MIKELVIFFRARPANGAPSVVGADISTMHLLNLVREPDDVAREAEVGRMMCRSLCPDMLTFVAWEKLGFRIDPTA
jgi:hypothetical protein